MAAVEIKVVPSYLDDRFSLLALYRNIFLVLLLLVLPGLAMAVSH